MRDVNTILIDIFKISENEVSKNLTMDDVNNWDSITHMDLIVTIEDEFQIQLEGDDIADMISFDSIRKIVDKYTKK